MSRLAIPRVVKMPIEAQATDALRDSIVGGAIQAGQRITEVELSEQMNLSRATVRSALHQLAKEGLLTLVPYTGWRVVLLSAADVWELYTLRSAVERLAAQLLAASIDGAGRERLAGALAALTEACDGADGARIAEADFSLHKTIIDLTRHGRLAGQYGLIEQQIRICIRSSDALVAGGDTIVGQHRPIVEAILAGAVEEAGQLSEAHNLTEGRKLADHLGSLEALQPPPPEPAPAGKARRPRRAA